MMTNEEVIKLLSRENIPTTLDGKLNEPLLIAHIKAISVLEENTKLKAEIEQLKEEVLANKNWSDVVERTLKKEIDKNEMLKSKLEQLVKLPLTNADKIRSMSDEELAEFLINIKSGTDLTFGEYVHFNYTIFSSTGQIIKWLQSEVSE